MHFNKLPEIEDFGPREDVIFKQQFSLFICIIILYINILCSFSVQIKPVCFCSCFIKYFSPKNSIPIQYLIIFMVGETLA